MATMLQLIQQATGELGLAVPNSVAGNTAQDTIQQLALLNAVGYDLLRAPPDHPEFNWQALTTEYRFTTQWVQQTGNVTAGSAVVTNIPSTAGIVAGTYMVTGAGINQDTYVQSVDSMTQVTLTQAAAASGTGVLLTYAQTKYAFPADYQRVVDRTQWDKSKHWEMLGPESPQQWQWLKSGYIATGPRIRWRILGNAFQIWPAVSTSEYLGFEYVSKYWVVDGNTGSSKGAFTLDSDTCLFDDRLMVTGLKLKYFGIKGFETQLLQDEYDSILSALMGAEQGAPMLSMAPRLSNILLGPENIPDSNYGVTQ
jgi:hypothetical protein